jgi:hypothetical protein
MSGGGTVTYYIIVRMFLQRVWLILILGMTASAMAQPTPLSPIILNASNGHEYVLLHNANWTDSEAEAELMGGHLATVRNAAEQDWIINTFGAYNGNQHLLWLGLNDTNTAFDFVWASGEPLAYTNWASGEPNNAGGVEHYVAMYYPNFNQPGTWNDWTNRTTDPGGKPFNGVVEIIPSFPFALTPPILNPGNNHYYFLLTNADWTDSEVLAESAGGHLATIRNQAEQDWVFNTFGSYGGQQRLLWIGLNDTNQLFDFNWVAGGPVTYTNWATGEPNNSSGNERYVAVYYPNFNQPGAWNDWSDRTSDPIGLPFNGVVEVVPQLSCVIDTNGAIQISWPLALSGETLGATTNLSEPFAPFAYSRTTNAADGTITATVIPIGPQMFFRLYP